jgi:hypothetical protein
VEYDYGVELLAHVATARARDQRRTWPKVDDRGLSAATTAREVR